MTKLTHKATLKRQKHWLKYSKTGQFWSGHMTTSGIKNYDTFLKKMHYVMLLESLMRNIHNELHFSHTVFNTLQDAENRGFYKRNGRRKKQINNNGIQDILRRISKEDSPRKRALLFKKELKWPTFKAARKYTNQVSNLVEMITNKSYDIFFDPCNKDLETEIKNAYRELHAQIT